MTHKLKILHKYFEAVRLGNKTFEVRKDDRGFNEGDILILQEWTPNGYTEREIEVAVTYILRDTEYCKEGFCIIGIKLVAMWQQDGKTHKRCTNCKKFLIPNHKSRMYEYCPNCGATIYERKSQYE